jgi:hypothetical protein
VDDHVAHHRLASADPVRYICSAIHEGGPFFTPQEQAVISRKCGYAPGEWSGHDFSINNGVFTCPNGRKVDDAEMRALLQVAQPRITARINAVMARPEVQAAIRETANGAMREALANLSERYREAD